MTVQQALINLDIKYFGLNFESWFFPCDFNEKAKNHILIGQKLPRAMNDKEILKELKPSEVTIEEIAETLKTLDHSTYNLFYCKDKDGVLRTVDVGWRGDGWFADADALDAYGWLDGRRVFSRNSREPKTLDSSNVLSLDSLDIRIQRLEEVMFENHSQFDK